METFLNYLGQFRLYSLTDLIILLIATQAGLYDFLGVLFLHLGFLVFLETQHSHSNRREMPKWLWIFLIIIGISLYRHLEVIPFLFLSYFYVKKTEGNWGYTAPILRGFQYFFLIGGILGYFHLLTWIALIVIFIRNFAGDLRDITKDMKDNLKTLPILVGFRHDIQYIHLVIMLTTSLIWWNFASLPLWSLLLIFVIQIFSYNIT